MRSTNDFVRVAGLMVVYRKDSAKVSELTGLSVLRPNATGENLERSRFEIGPSRERRQHEFVSVDGLNGNVVQNFVIIIIFLLRTSRSFCRSSHDGRTESGCLGGALSNSMCK